MSSGKSESSKKIMNMIYGIGASVVILGALFKLMHWPGGNVMLIAGLLTEAAIFFISAFESPDEELDWSLVYPQLKQVDEYDDYSYEEEGSEEYQEYEEEPVDEDPIATRIDELFRNAKIDSALFENLSGSLNNLSSAASGISSTLDAADYTRRYSEEMAAATESIKSLNEFYSSQREQNTLQTTFNEQVLQAADQVKGEMETLAENLYSLNSVYGNMLTAMKN